MPTTPTPSINVCTNCGQLFYPPPNNMAASLCADCAYNVVQHKKEAERIRKTRQKAGVLEKNLKRPTPQQKRNQKTSK